MNFGATRHRSPFQIGSRLLSIDPTAWQVNLIDGDTVKTVLPLVPERSFLFLSNGRVCLSFIETAQDISFTLRAGLATNFAAQQAASWRSIAVTALRTTPFGADDWTQIQFHDPAEQTAAEAVAHGGYSLSVPTARLRSTVTALRRRGCGILSTQRFDELSLLASVPRNDQLTAGRQLNAG